jgi:hypothetical protein
MSDIILAECGDQAWLVCGEQHIDDLLANTLAAYFTVEIIACESQMEVNALWREYNGREPKLSMMWLIHPAIVNRVRGAPTETGVAFAAWSAALDDAAQAVLKRVADGVRGQSSSRLVLVRYLPASPAAMALELANLRSWLIEARLGELGVAPTQLIRETVNVERAEQTDWIALVIRS